MNRLPAWLSAPALGRLLGAALAVRRQRQAGRGWIVESLEERAVPAAFSVDRLTDDGPALVGEGSGNTGDLRYCIIQAGTQGENDTIQFTAAGEVQLRSSLPLIIDQFTLVGLGASSTTITRAAGTPDFRL